MSGLAWIVEASGCWRTGDRFSSFVAPWDSLDGTETVVLHVIKNVKKYEVHKSKLKHVTGTSSQIKDIQNWFSSMITHI